MEDSVEGIVIGVLSSVAVYLINLPFMVLAFRCSFYRDRLRQALRLPDEGPPTIGLPLVWRGAVFSLGEAIEPTTRPVEIADVAQCWRFYLGRESSTVTVALKEDGTFAQRISRNAGEATRCPGGTWRLDGPLVHLTGYATARQGELQSRTWWVVDTKKGFAMYGGDDSDGDSCYVMTRMPKAAIPFLLPHEAHDGTSVGL